MNAATDTAFVALEFLRPAWLLGPPVLALLTLWWWRRGRGAAASGWDAAVDPALRPYVLEGDGEAAARNRAPYALLGVWTLACLVLSGPVFERRPVPVREAPAAEVVMLDLSPTMRATDLKPDRISRARYKLDDFLARGRGLRIGLVAFAERPYTIAPLTDDADTLRSFLPGLVPEIVPVQGSRPDLAIRRGIELLDRGAGDGRGAAGGHLVLVTDAAVDDATLAAARRVRELGHRLSVLGVGTPDGEPLRDAQARFVTTPDGAIVVPRLDPAGPARLAAAGGGAGVVLADDARDLDALDAVRAALAPGSTDPTRDGPDRDGVWWIERGPWLVPLLALAALLPFRRRVDA